MGFLGFKSLSSQVAISRINPKKYGFDYKLYNGYYGNSPDGVHFTDTAPLRNGFNNIDMGISSDLTSMDSATQNNMKAGSSGNFTLEWNGFSYTGENTGTFTFYLGSDDGSYLWIGDTATKGSHTSENALINNNHVGPFYTFSNTILLQSNTYYPIRILYGQNDRGSNFTFNFEKPNDTTRIYNGTGYYYSNIFLLPQSKVGGIYGVKLLNYKYKGAIFNIRRGSDNATDDFYYTNSTLTNLSGILITDFLNGSIAYITTWYDQSRKENHGTQTNLSLQPIYDPTNLYVDFTSSRYVSLPDGTVPFGNSNYTVTIKHNEMITNASATWLSGGTFSRGQCNNFRMAGTKYYNYWYDVGYYSNGGYAVGNNVTYQYDGSTVKCYINSVLNSEETPSILKKSTTNDNYIGALKGGGEPMNGQLYYLHIRDSVLTAHQRAQIEL